MVMMERADMAATPKTDPALRVQVDVLAEVDRCADVLHPAGAVMRWLAFIVEGAGSLIDGLICSHLVLSVCARATRGTVVNLTDYDGKQTLTIAYYRDGRLTAERWWPHSIRTVELLPDGQCARYETDGIVKVWSAV